MGGAESLGVRRWEGHFWQREWRWQASEGHKAWEELKEDPCSPEVWGQVLGWRAKTDVRLSWRSRKGPLGSH